MAKVFVPKSSCIFSVIIFLLLVLSVGLLVFVLKGQIHHENSTAAKSGHGQDSSSVPKEPTYTPSPQTAPKGLATRSTPGQTDHGHTTESSPVEKSLWDDFRLPKFIIPLHYDLLLHPNIPNDNFTGSVNITVNVTMSTGIFIVHAYKLVMQDSKVFDYRTEAEINVVKSFLFDHHEYFVIETEKVVDPGIYKLSMIFSGSLVGGIVGFYKSRYADRNNQTRYLATSKFQPTYARKAFPCFDEPSFKSTFTVSLVHDSDYIALSNMPVDETKSYFGSGQMVTKFQTSVPMVTYLACFIVCDFKYQETTTSAGKKFRVYSTPDQVNQTTYALKFGSRVLEYFEDYFGIDFPLPKQDMVAIPDFSSGAMEHWGVISFREVNLLVDEEKSSDRVKQRVLSVISHEMTHMWFGNLVTMEWWDDLWLNEGFASYVEYKGIDEQYPEWDMMSQFVTADLQSVMDIDSTMNSHPIVQPVKDPDEITEIFDDISYKKGASILRMLEFFVGNDNFRKGISQFLKKYQFQNAKTADLWEELSEACGNQDGNHTIKSIMKTWTEQMGFPYITVKRLQSFENETLFVAKQRRFVKNQEQYLRNIAAASKEYVWSVPLSYITADGLTDIIWMFDAEEKEFTIPTNTSKFVKFNVNQTGYYLVNYEKEEWDRIIDVLMTNHEVFSPADRANLLFDSYSLAEAGHLPFDVFLSMTKYLKNETHLVPWETAYDFFVELCTLMEFTEVNSLLKSHINDLTSSLYKKFGWSSLENHLDNFLQTTILGLACHSGNQECLSYAVEQFQNWTQGQKIASRFHNQVYHYGMSEIGQEEHWNFMWNKYMAEESASERKSLLYGLAHIRLPHLIHRYLEYAMDEQKIRRQDFFTVLNYISGNPIGKPVVWNFIRNNWKNLVNRFTLNDRYLGLSVKIICSSFTTEYELQQMKEFFAKFPDAGAGKRRRQQALEIVQNNIKWIKTHKQSIKSWLQSEGTTPWYHHRLPPHIVPEHYDLLVHPMMDQDHFNGSVTITVLLLKPSRNIIVHAADLNVSNTEVTFLEDASTVEVDEVFLYNENEYLVLKFDRKLKIGKYKLYFEFEGPLTVSLKGLYKSSYVDPDTMETKYLATTQFEAISARRAFPCFDEPTFKTTFTVGLIHDTNHFALSNSEVDEIIELDNRLLKTRFHRTVPMCVYLVALVVCDFKYKETITESGVKLRVYAASHQIERVDYALNAGSKILSYFESYFDVPFPLKKLDMIAIPDFSANGMENWGLITYSEKALLTDESSSSDSKRYTTTIIAHELAHMWFGDLVTMTWWSDLWLNEGFATYISEKGVKHAAPEFDEGNSGFVNSLSTAMTQDMTVNSHPIVQLVTKVKDGIFDSITYKKGSSVLGMLENYMGEDFRKGVSAYLKKYAYRSARTEDLWEELTKASSEGLNVTAIMETWTKQMNYPFVTIKRKPYATEKFSLQQQRFLVDPATVKYSVNQSPYDYVWQIPLTYRASNNPEIIQHVLINSSDTVMLNLPDSDWIKFNVNFTGYYSVNYELSDWQRFVDILQNDHEVFSTTDRVNLLFDAFSLATAGHLDYNIPLNMTTYLRNETYHGAWSRAFDELTKIKHYFRNDRSVKDIIKEYIRSLSKDLLRKYTWEDRGNYSEKKLRRLLIETACSNGNQECLLMAGSLFKNWMKGAELDRETRKMVYKFGLRVMNDEESWNFVWQNFLNETDPGVKSDLQNALTAVRNNTFIERFMELAKNDSFVRKHDYLKVLQLIAWHQKGFPLVTSFLFSNWSEIVEKYGSSKAEYFAQGVFQAFDSEKDLKKVIDFYKKNRNTKDSERPRALAIERILENIRWHEQHKPTVMKWLQKQVYMPWKNSRLPRHIKPSKYEIMLHPDIPSSKFQGEEEISLNISEPTDYLLIHETDLKVIKTEIKNVDTDENVTIDESFQYKKNNFWVIRFSKMISEGQYLLKMQFSGQFADNGDGMTRYSYKVDDGERYLVATKFEPTDARRVFPCFDEPDMKATFKLSIIHESNYTALSNMPEEEKIILNNSLVQTTFDESVTMSTYLLCCVVSDFDYIETNYRDKKIRVYAPAENLNDAHHGLNLTVKLLEKYEEYFDVPYMLPKLDSIVIPAYTVPAMEHWGAIIYNSGHFLVHDEITEYKRLLNVDRVIAHELAHQWFGNLVTMKWWNDLWLNEGFSTLIMYMPLREYYPTAEQLDVRKVSKMMCTDSSMDSHPIRQNVSHPPDISDLFDNISYEKGNAVLKMLQHTLKDDFRVGLSNYLKKYAYKNAETKDLWDEFSKASEKDLNITEVMNTWTCQMGFPYVELSRDGNTLTATQRWFLRKKNDSAVSLLAQRKELSPYGFVWKIPLVYKNLATGNEYTLWLNDKNATFNINAMEDDILKFNPGFVGYYVVKYDEDDYEKISKHLMENHTVFSVTDRYNLLHDAFVLAESGRLLYDIPLQFTKYLKNERELLPWTIFRDKFHNFLQVIDGNSETVKLLKEYVKQLTSDLYDGIAWSDNKNRYYKQWQTRSESCPFTYQDLDFSSTIIDLACLSSNEKCLTSMNEELQLWLHGNETTVDLRLVLRAAIPYVGNHTLWNLLYDRFIDPSATYRERLLIVHGLASFVQPSEITRTIEVMMTDPTVNSTLARDIFEEFSQNPTAIPLLWNYTKNNWESLLVRFDSQNNPTAGISIFCDAFKTLHFLGDFIRFLKSVPQMNEYIISACLEDIQVSINWSDRYEETLLTWLRWNLS